MNNSPIFHSDNHPKPNEDNIKKTQDWDGISDNEDFLQDIINTTPDLIYLIDLNSGNIAYINKRAEDIFGYDSNYIYQSGVNFLQELVHPDDKEKRDKILLTASDGAVIETEIRLKVKGGHYHWFRMRDRIMKKRPDATVWQTIGLGFDITSQKDGLINISRLKSLFDSTKTGVMLLRPIKDGNGNATDFKLVQANRFAETFFNKKLVPDTLHSTNFGNYKNDGVFKTYSESLATQKKITFDTTYINLDGDHKTIKQTIVPLENGDLAITFNNNELSYSEDTLKEQSKLIQGIANAIPDILFVLDLNTKSIIYANKQIAKVLGYNDDQISTMGHPILDIIYEEDKSAMIKHLDDMLTAEDGEVREIEYRMKNVDGSLHWFIDRNTVFKRNDKGVPIEKIGIAQDITLRKTQENKINKSLKILQQTEELAQIGNWDYDIRTKSFSWSDGMYTLFDMKKDTPITPSVYLTYVLEQDKPLAEKIVAAIQDTHEPFTEILRIQLENEIKTLKIKSGIYKDDKGIEISMVGVDIDITASILTEMQIKELNHHLQTKNRGLESANTDLKAFNTLAATNYRQTLQKLYTSMEYLITNDAKNLSNEGRANIRRAQSSIQKMKLMTEDMINLSKLHTLDTQLAEVNLNDTIAEVTTNLNDKITEAKALINFTVMPVIQGYSILVSLLFHHLLDNAIKFRRQDVPLIINITNKTEKLKDIAYYVITITDNGIGFEEENAQEVFTMFYRHSDTSFKGSGIGLAVCKKIMDIHDGFIIAKSTLKKETTFSCYFPVEKH